MPNADKGRKPGSYGIPPLVTLTAESPTRLLLYHPMDTAPIGPLITSTTSYP